MLRRVPAALLLAFFALVTQGQSIVTVAGGGTVDGQKLSDILVNGASGITFDAAGNLLVTLSSGGQVLRVDAATGVVKAIAGNGAAGFTGDGSLAVNASLRQAEGIALDPDGNIYLADSLNNRIRRVDAKSGIITTYAGGGTPPSGIGDNGPAASAEIDAPWGLVIDRGFLYVSETAYNANRIRRIDMSTGAITTIAGATDGSVGGFGGDGGPAVNARFNGPYGMAVDKAGNLYVSDRDNGRVRRIDTNGNISTYAGGGPAGALSDGIAATAADIQTNGALAFDTNGNLLLASTQVGVRRVDKNTGLITTVFSYPYPVYGLAVDSQGAIYFADGSGTIARFRSGDTQPEELTGNGTYVGDGLHAVAAILHSPQGLALDRGGNLYIVDQNASIIRRVSAADSTISTVAGSIGKVYAPPEQEGSPATDAAIGYPTDIAFDANGNLFIADELNGRIWRVDAVTGTISSYAGGGSPSDGVGDGGPATAAAIVPWGLSFDLAGNLLIADNDPFATVPHARIRKVDAATKGITTIAGTAVNGYAGDGGPATQAQLDRPVSAVVDGDGNIFIADGGNGAIRRIDHATGVITTYAGHKGESDPLGDGGPAAEARLSPLHLFVNRTTGDLYAPDFSSHRLRKFDHNGIVSTVAGSGFFYLDGGFGGDNGPATSARLSFDYGDVSGVVVNANGEVVFSDSQNNRIRSVLSCRSVGAPSLTAPSANATNVATAPKLTWSAVPGAVRYEVRLDTANPPTTAVATDVDGTSFTPANLQAITKYYWQVVAKGDRYCPAAATATSAVSAFTTTGTCAAGAFDLVSPANGATQVPSSTLLTWQASSGAATYDLYLGNANPPPLFATGISTTTYAASAAGTELWFVVAHASCDATETASTPVRSFTVIPPGGCVSAFFLDTSSPVPSATGVSTTTQLLWASSGNFDSYEVYFGTSNPPPLFAGRLSAATRSIDLPSLLAGTTYYWQVVGHASCGPPPVTSTQVRTFTTRADCPTPGGTQILFAPPAVNAGATYAIVWSPATSLDADGGYLVERSTSPGFGTILDAQVTSSTAASFLAQSPGTIYHRVRAVPGCDPTKVGPTSDVKSVAVTAAPPNVIFTVTPHAVVTALGDSLENQRSTFTLENIGSSSVQVIIGRQEIGSAPFFSIVEDAAFITLPPRTPRTFTLRYSGPRNDVAGSYQGVIFVAATGQGGLAVTPYAFVNLKVGGGNAAVPKFLVDGLPSDYAAFAGFGGDDATRPSRQVTIRNDGTAPMELAAEIGPDVWLVPKSDWNATALAPGASRTIDLFTQRSRAPNGSPLPRYTYFTVRTKDGASARLLVQDNDALAVRTGRSSALDATTRSFVVPEVVSKTSVSGHRLVTRMRLTNAGGDAVQAELIFTPSGVDGFDGSGVVRVTVVVPPNDVVAITDPIVQLFGLTAPASGAIEVRLPRERVGLVAVRSSIIPLGAPGGFETPVVARGEGARTGAPHVLYLLPQTTVSLTVAETSGNDGAALRIVTFDANGAQTSTQGRTLGRYGSVRLDNLTASRIELDVDSGGGSVVGVATISSASGESGATVLSRAVTEQSSTASAVARSYKMAGDAVAALSVTTVVPLVNAYKTSVGFVAPPSLSATFDAILHASGGSSVGTTKSVTIPAGGTKFYTDIMNELFGVPAGGGSVFITSPSTSKVYAVVNSGTTSTTVPSSFLTLPTTLSEALTSAAAAAQRTLSFDGLEQTTDPTHGDHWLLVLNEVAGASGSVNVRLYEAANRTSPIATGDFPVGAYQELTLDTIFSQLGLDEPDRQKDRTNVQIVVTATNGAARLAATAVAVSVETGEARSYALTPAVGGGTPNVVFVAPGTTPGPPVPPGKRRIVTH